MLCTISLLALSCAFVSCSTVYSRMYTPKKSNYVRPAEKAAPTAADLLPPEQTTVTTVPPSSPLLTPDPTTTPSTELPPPTDAAPPAEAPAPIPGL